MGANVIDKEEFKCRLHNTCDAGNYLKISCAGIHRAVHIFEEAGSRLMAARGHTVRRLNRQLLLKDH
jgi:hypothetical protein